MCSISENLPSNISVISKPENHIFGKNKEKEARKYLQDYCQNSSIHGLKYLAEKRSLSERLLWSFLIITSITICGYLINRIYKKYDQNPVIVSFATKQSQIFTIPFPAVTICPTTKSDVKKLNYTKIIHSKKRNQSVTTEEEIHAQYLSLICQEGIEHFPNNKTFTDEILYQLDKLKPRVYLPFICRFMWNYFPCEHVFKHIILDEGICYTFNMMDREEIFRDNVVHYSIFNKNENVSEWNIDDGYSNDSKADTYPRRGLLSGADNSLQITLIHNIRDTDYTCLEDVLGYSVALHTPHAIPLVKKQHFQVPFDTSVMAAIQPRMMTTSQEVKKYNPGDRECYFTNERPLKYFKIYTPENCRLECLVNYTLKQCGCVNFFMPRVNSTLICGNGNYDCMKNAERDLKLIELNNHMDVKGNKNRETYCDCMPLCTELYYDIEQTQTEWKWNEKFRVRVPDGYMYRQNNIKLAKLTVFFKTEQFLSSQRNEMYGPIDFLANFGGLLGLFTGFSILSLIEIIYYLTVRIFCDIRQRNE